MSKEKLTGQATAEQIQEWKDKHGDIFKIQVENSVCYLKAPNRKVLGYASVAGKDNPLKFNEVILESCWLGGDEMIKTDDSLFLSAGAKINGIVEVKEANLEKL